jgi:8-oxo-dGTP diphosphatase
MWDGPAGHMELGETPEEALHREAMEELGVRLEILGLNGVFSKRDRPVVFVSYAATTFDEPVPGDEVAEVRWVSRSQIPWPEVFEDAREPLRVLIQNGYLG